MGGERHRHSSPCRRSVAPSVLSGPYAVSILWTDGDRVGTVAAETTKLRHGHSWPTGPQTTDRVIEAAMNARRIGPTRFPLRSRAARCQRLSKRGAADTSVGVLARGRPIRGKVRPQLRGADVVAGEFA